MQPFDPENPYHEHYISCLVHMERGALKGYVSERFGQFGFEGTPSFNFQRNQERPIDYLIWTISLSRDLLSEPGDEVNKQKVSAYLEGLLQICLEIFDEDLDRCKPEDKHFSIGGQALDLIAEHIAERSRGRPEDRRRVYELLKRYVLPQEDARLLDLKHNPVKSIARYSGRDVYLDFLSMLRWLQPRSEMPQGLELHGFWNGLIADEAPDYQIEGYKGILFSSQLRHSLDLIPRLSATFKAKQSHQLHHPDSFRVAARHYASCLYNILMWNVGDTSLFAARFKSLFPIQGSFEHQMNVVAVKTILGLEPELMKFRPAEELKGLHQILEGENQ